MTTESLSSSRRDWLAQALGLLATSAAPRLAFAQERAHIVIVGGGVGGATTAKYLKLFNPALKVTVIEKNRTYVRPYGSSEVLNQHVRMDDLNVSYDALKDTYGVNFVFDTVTGFDPVKRTVSTAATSSRTGQCEASRLPAPA